MPLAVSVVDAPLQRSVPPDEPTDGGVGVAPVVIEIALLFPLVPHALVCVA